MPATQQQRLRIVILARYRDAIDDLFRLGTPFAQIEAWIDRLRIPGDSREVLHLYAISKL